MALFCKVQKHKQIKIFLQENHVNKKKDSKKVQKL
uniref:Uncharacterized protein n=1 Tax=Rhizophora mucronata TaxID=61149 RepID=A0A2P2MQ96_RHIMU